MLKSMTGYGQVSKEDNDLSIDIEVKSVNSKNLDLNFYTPKCLNFKELEWRKTVSQILERGKISISVCFSQSCDTINDLQNLDKKLFQSNYTFLKDLSQSVNDTNPDLFGHALKYTISSSKDQSNVLTKKQYTFIDKSLLEALTKCDESRRDEGATLHKKFNEYSTNIINHTEEIIKHAPNRVVEIKSRIRDKVSDLLRNVDILDESRFEQELIYYIERLDIEEESIRLINHLKSFDTELNSSKPSGKKLSFIIQEILREANTTGSKANDTFIQSRVILIKEEIEKIKEQLSNIL